MGRRQKSNKLWLFLFSESIEFFRIYDIFWFTYFHKFLRHETCKSKWTKEYLTFQLIHNNSYHLNEYQFISYLYFLPCHYLSLFVKGLSFVYGFLKYILIFLYFWEYLSHDYSHSSIILRFCGFNTCQHKFDKKWIYEWEKLSIVQKMWIYYKNEG